MRQITGRRRRRGPRRDHRLGQARRAGEQLGALVRIRAGHAWLEQLTHDPETEIALQLAAAPMQHAEAHAGRDRARLLEQARLADPRRSLDHRRPPLAGAGIRQQRPQHGQVALALQQGRHAGAGTCLG